MTQRQQIAAFALCAALAGLPPQAVRAGETPRVIVTVKPVHSLVAGVMAGIAEPELLMPGGSSPHAYALRPSQAASLERAGMVIRVSETLELFLGRPIANLAAKARVLTLEETPGLILFPVREGGLWEEHGHDRHGGAPHDSEKPGHIGHDPHIWLDPMNAKLLVGRVAAALSGAWPWHRAAFEANAARIREKLDSLHAELATATSPLAGRPYIVFHDAYRYFEARYGLTPAGSVTVSPDRMPGARRLRDIRERIARSGAICIFAEPQFEPRLVATLIEGTAARRGVLDPLGAAARAGPGLYFALMRRLASDLAACLAPKNEPGG